MSIVVVMGRGGTGKTSFVALMTKALIEAGVEPILLVDADPDQNLAEMVGVSLEDVGIKTISELLVETFIEGSGTLVGVPPAERIESRIWQAGIYEGDYFDLISIGTKWVEGCYCLPNVALKNALGKLAKNYKYVLIDSPAGLEHLNRRITSSVDDIFDLIDPSQKAFNHLRRALRIIKEVGISFRNFYVVGCFRFPRDLEPGVCKELGIKYLGKVAYDRNVEEYVLKGRSLLEIPSDSPAYISVKEILSKAGYLK